MKKILFLAAILMIAVLTLVAAPTASAGTNDCAGQVVIHNNSSYVVQMIAINNPWEHLDVPPGQTYLGHIPYNQPMGFAKDVPGVGEIKLFKLAVDWKCEFGGDAHVWVDNNSASYQLAQGFSTAW